MSWAKITLTGFEDYLQMSGKSLFDGLILPEGIDKDTLCNNIFINAGEFGVLYTDPGFLQAAIGNWGRKWYRTFSKWISALNIEYEPLFNYDRHEEWTDEGSGSRKNETTAESETNREAEVNYEGSDETTNTRSAFDSDDYQPHDKSVTDSENKTTSEGKDTSSGSGTLSEDTENKSEHKGHMFGNIGTVSSQKMLGDELQIAEWNIYEHITDMFIREFLIPVY